VRCPGTVGLGAVLWRDGLLLLLLLPLPPLLLGLL